MSMIPITARKAMQQFVPASLRQRCATCGHLNIVRDLWLSCGRGGFSVTPWSVCIDWKSAAGGLKPVPNRSKTESQAHGAEAGSSAPAADGQKEAP